MRQNLGSLLVAVLLFLASTVYANEPYTWSLKANKSSVYVNEAIAIEYTCDFQDQAYLHVIELNIAGENEEYRLLSQGVVETIQDGKRRDTFRYVLFPKKAGQKEFSFKVLMRKTTKDSIENSVIGRDNVEDYAFNDQEVLLPLLNLEVLGHQEKMTGHFSMDVTLDKSEVKAYEPVHLDLKVSGEGDYRDFTIKPIELRYFDTIKKERIVLRSEIFEVNVKEAYTKEELLDDVEERGETWWSWSYLNYLFIFVLGLILGRYSLGFKRMNKSIEGFEAELMACRSVNSVLTKLVLRGDEQYIPLIKKYEALGKTALLRELKTELKTLFKRDSTLSDTITELKGKDV
jgi:hypothetical protein